MKNRLESFVIILILISVIQLTAQQTLEISFEARHYEGENVQLDSILIKNITRNCDTILFAPDTSLVLLYYVGVKENKYLENEFYLTQNYPNPIENGETSFDLIIYENKKVVFELFDIMGRRLFHLNKELRSGSYKFNLLIEREGTFILRTNIEGYNKTIKIINHNTVGTGNIKLEESSFYPNFNNILKTQTRRSGFWFEPGDTLWYAAYSVTPHGVLGSDVLEGAPTIQEHIFFKIIEGLPCINNIAVKHGGHLYPTVQFGEQCWLKENLKIGTMIDGINAMTDNDIIEKYCYDNNAENCDEYGGLYQWWELMQYSEEEATQGICPNGWHIATEGEFMLIIEDIDGEACKERGNSHWEPGYNTGGDNLKGITILGSGYRQNNTNFYQLGTFAAFHSSTKMTFDWVWYLGFGGGNQMFFGTTLKEVGHAVRCIKD